MQRILDTINAPAYVRNGRMDILATNRLGQALFAGALGTNGRFNLARYLFLDPRAQGFYTDWRTVAADSVAPKPAATPMTVPSLTSSGNSAPAANRSAPGGPLTM